MRSLMFTMSVAVALGYLLFARELSDFGSRAVRPNLWPGQIDGPPPATVAVVSAPGETAVASAPPVSADPAPSPFSTAPPATVAATLDAVATSGPGWSEGKTAMDPVPTVAEEPLVVPEADRGDTGTVKPRAESDNQVSRPPPDTVLDARALRRLAADLEIAAIGARVR